MKNEIRTTHVDPATVPLWVRKSGSEKLADAILRRELFRGDHWKQRGKHCFRAVTLDGLWPLVDPGVQKERALTLIASAIKEILEENIQDGGPGIDGVITFEFHRRTPRDKIRVKVSNSYGTRSDEELYVYIRPMPEQGRKIREFIKNAHPSKLQGMLDEKEMRAVPEGADYLRIAGTGTFGRA